MRMISCQSASKIPDTLEDKKMSYEKVAQAIEKVIGTKQTLKALEEGFVKELYIAEDAECKVVYKVVALAEKNDVPIIKVLSMKKLGKACGIDVSAATVAILK
jgi:large subunit ribosomal protein L7A